MSKHSGQLLKSVPKAFTPSDNQMKRYYKNANPVSEARAREWYKEYNNINIETVEKPPFHKFQEWVFHKSLGVMKIDPDFEKTYDELGWNIASQKELDKRRYENMARRLMDDFDIEYLTEDQLKSLISSFPDYYPHYSKYPSNYNEMKLYKIIKRMN